ncbi:MAG: hypothetical protein ACOCSE_03505 [Chitinivibrionales bacterium]
MIYLSLLFLLITMAKAESEHVDFSLHSNFNGYVDNREYRSSFPSYTIFGSNVSTKAEINLKDRYSLYSGILMGMRFGRETEIDDFQPLLYISYKNASYSFSFGSFKSKAKNRMPKALISDSLRIERPYTEGISLTGFHKYGSISTWIDWTSFRTGSSREAFRTGLSAGFYPTPFFIRSDLLYYHLARSYWGGEKIHDNGGFMLTTGFRFHNQALIDSLSVSAAPLLMFDRIRGEYSWQTPAGIKANIKASFLIISVSLTYYKRVHGSRPCVNLSGDNFYSSDEFFRTGLSLKIFDTKSIDSEIKLYASSVERKLNFRQYFQILVSIPGYSK